MQKFSNILWRPKNWGVTSDTFIILENFITHVHIRYSYKPDLDILTLGAPEVDSLYWLRKK